MGEHVAALLDVVVLSSGTQFRVRTMRRKMQIAGECEDDGLTLWELGYSEYVVIRPILDEKGATVCLIDEHGATTGIATHTAPVPSGFYWREALRDVRRGSLKLTVCRSITGDDRIYVNPDMLDNLKIVSFKGPDPVLEDLNGTKFFLPRFHEIPDEPFADWNSIAVEALYRKYEDGVLPAEVSITGLARDALKAAAEHNSRVSKIVNDKDAISLTRRAIGRILKRRRIGTKKHKVPTSSDIRTR
jgi:hypothetical protein